MQGGFHELVGVVSVRRRGGRRRDIGRSSYAPDGAQEAEVRGLAERGTARSTSEYIRRGFCAQQSLHQFIILTAASYFFVPSVTAVRTGFSEQRLIRSNSAGLAR